jgi:6-pyruvoyltetrahydropterin/6-carboxytetrahydropterin synthase
VATASLTRIVQFAASHRYFHPAWSAERNAAAFGAAAADHGHTYQCAITVRGATDPVTGMVVDLGLLDRVIGEEVVSRFGGRHINEDLPEYAYGRTIPTGEMLCVDIWRRIAARLPAECTLEVVRVQEDPSLYAEYRGEA